jgi:glycerophosphoryl diester phosphodiesterase
MIVLGHRGGRGEGWPAENTLEAFQRALDEGADGVELDVRLCASGEPVVAHDPSLARVTEGTDTRRIHAVRRADLPTLRGGARIPTLVEALDLCRGRIVNVELKTDGERRWPLVRAVRRDLERTGATDVVVSSFDPAVILALAAVTRRFPLAILVGQRTPRLGGVLPLAMARVVVAAHLADELVVPRRVGRIHRAGLRVVAWTVNDGARALALARLGVDWLITDQPRAILTALQLGRD